MSKQTTSIQVDTEVFKKLIEGIKEDETISDVIRRLIEKDKQKRNTQ